jgi:hypothetical protein
VTQDREGVAAQRPPQREARADRPPSGKIVEQPAQNTRSQAEVAKAGKRLTLAKAEPPKHLPPNDLMKGDAQLRELETKVAAAVAIRRSSELFGRVDALEAQYAKANLLSGKVKARFDLLRLNMARKLPGPPRERLSIEPFIPPVVTRQPSPFAPQSADQSAPRPDAVGDR